MHKEETCGTFTARITTIRRQPQNQSLTKNLAKRKLSLSLNGSKPPNSKLVGKKLMQCGGEEVFWETEPTRLLRKRQKYGKTVEKNPRVLFLVVIYLSRMLLYFYLLLNNNRTKLYLCVFSVICEEKK